MPSNWTPTPNRLYNWCILKSFKYISKKIKHFSLLSWSDGCCVRYRVRVRVNVHVHIHVHVLPTSLQCIRTNTLLFLIVFVNFYFNLSDMNLIKKKFNLSIIHQVDDNDDGDFDGDGILLNDIMVCCNKLQKQQNKIFKKIAKINKWQHQRYFLILTFYLEMKKTRMTFSVFS